MRHFATLSNSIATVYGTPERLALYVNLAQSKEKSHKFDDEHRQFDINWTDKSAHTIV